MVLINKLTDILTFNYIVKFEFFDDLNFLSSVAFIFGYLEFTHIHPPSKSM